jgi:hypothetical protein
MYSFYLNDDILGNNDDHYVNELLNNYIPKYYIADDMNAHHQKNGVHNMPHYDNVHLGHNIHKYYKDYNYYYSHARVHHHEQIPKLAKNPKLPQKT